LKKRHSGPAVVEVPRPAVKAAAVKKPSVPKEPTKPEPEPETKHISKRSEDNWVDPKLLRACPKNILCQLLGRVSANGEPHYSTVDNWSANYGMPVRGGIDNKVDLFELLKWFGDRLAKFGAIEGSLEALEEEEGEGTIATWTLNNLKAKHENLKADTRWKELRNERTEGVLIDQPIVRRAHAEIAAVIFELFQELMDKGEPLAQLAQATYRRIQQCVDKIDDRTSTVDRPESNPAEPSASPAGDADYNRGADLVAASVPTEEAAGNHPVRRRRGRPSKRPVQPEGT
jgi:hypothetical protein